MKLRKNIKWLLIYSGLVICIAIGWISFAPKQLGGYLSYVILYGNSMEPLYYLGDLILIRPSVNFKIGDIVAYFNPDLGNSILHRITDIQSEFYVLKGDNNQWVDAYQPQAHELLGKLWLRIPYLGKVFIFLRNPIVISIGLSTVFFLFFYGSFRRKGKSTKSDTPSSRDNINWIQTVISMLLILLFFSLFLSVVTFSKSTTRVNPHTISLKHISKFSYSGEAPIGVYDNQIISEGQPIFPSLTCSVTLFFGYFLDGINLNDLNGTYKVDVLIEDPKSGWNRSQNLVKEAVFFENNLNISEQLNLCEIENKIKEFEKITSLSATTYFIEIKPFITIEGKSRTIKFNEEFKPNLRFAYDHTKFVLSPEISNEGQPLTPTKSSNVQTLVSERNKFSFFGMQLDVLNWRIFSVTGLIISIFGISILLIYINKIKRTDQYLAYQLMQGQDIYDLSGTSPQPSSNIVYFSTFFEFAKVSRSLGKLIFRQKSISSDVYFFNHDSVRYQFVDSHPIKTDKEESDD